MPAALRHSPGSSVLTGIQQYPQEPRAEPGSASPVTSKSVPNIENQSWLDPSSSSCFQQHAVTHRGMWTGEAQKATEERNIPERKLKLKKHCLIPLSCSKEVHTGCCWCWSPVLIPCLCCSSEHQQQLRSCSHRHSLPSILLIVHEPSAVLWDPAPLSSKPSFSPQLYHCTPHTL